VAERGKLAVQLFQLFDGHGHWALRQSHAPKVSGRPPESKPLSIRAFCLRGQRRRIARED
jgi:hypothetical protein